MLWLVNHMPHCHELQESHDGVNAVSRWNWRAYCRMWKGCRRISTFVIWRHDKGIRFCDILVLYVIYIRSRIHFFLGMALSYNLRVVFSQFSDFKRIQQTKKRELNIRKIFRAKKKEGRDARKDRRHIRIYIFYHSSFYHFFLPSPPPLPVSSQPIITTIIS